MPRRRSSAWAIQGPYFQLAYIAKGIEVALIALLVIDFARMDGNPVDVVKRELASLNGFVAGLAAPPAPGRSDPRTSVSASQTNVRRAASQ